MRSCLLACALASLLGCDQLRIVDEQSRPVAGARVFSLSPSAKAGPGTTDAQGGASLPPLAGRQWILIERSGFESAEMPVPQAFPCTITLRRTAAPEAVAPR